MSVDRRVLWALTSLILATFACTLISGSEVAEDGEITVVINTPEDNSQVPVNQEVSVQITITDPASVVNRQEIMIDGVVVAASEAVAPEGAPAFSVILPYTPTQPGSYALSAVAYGSDDTASEPAVITLVVVGEGDAEEEEGEEEEDEPQPTATVNPTSVPDASGCENNMSYLADVTIPDGTVMEPGESFTKTWRVRNSGTCDWGGYSLVFHSDDQMGGPASIVVPATPAGQTREISVNLTAPTTPGTHFSRWTMRSADGDLFGNIIFAEIEVQEAEVEGGADLIVAGVTTIPAEPEAGDVTQYSVEVENQGDDDAGATTLLGEFDTAGTATVTVPALAAGASTTVSLSATTPDKGQFEATFTADSEDDVTEADEGNNVLTTEFTYVTILDSGTVNIDEGHSVDLDTAATALGLCNGTTHDLHWEGDSPANRTLEPCNGASVALMGGSAVGLDECAAASLATSTIDIDGEEGSWVCAETSEGHLAAFQIDDLGSAIDPLVLSYTVYE